jgi:flagellar hook-associated protein 1 FlgK
MSSLSSIMDTSLSAMFAARVSLGTVAHNIANASTPGYSRQEVVFAARQPVRFTYGSLGRGVTIQNVRRMTDEFLLANQRAQSARLAGFAEVDAALQEIESVLGSVDSDVLGEALNQFFNAWSDLATPTYQPTLKQTVVKAAQNLTTTFRAIDGNLGDLMRNLQGSLLQELDGFNGILQQVAELNGMIVGQELGSNEANDLRDRREALILQASALAEVSVLEREDGTVDLIMDGRTLVTRNQAQALAGEWQKNEGEYALTIMTAQTRRPVSLAPGSLQGLLAAADDHVQQMRTGLDDLARLICEKVNELHVQGVSGGQAGLAFFTGDGAATLALNSVIADDFTRVATSRSGLSGDTDIARAIADLANAPLAGEGTASLTETYRSLQTDLASRRSSFQFMVENQNNLVDSVTARLESVRGVNLDEEGANMVRLQNAYDAAARVVTTVQELFDTLLEMV